MRQTSLDYYLLFFESAVQGSTAQLLANNTHVFLPSYQLKNGKVFIPEVRKEHVGTYYCSPIRFVDLGIGSMMKVKPTKLVIKECAVRTDKEYGSHINLTVPDEASVLEFTPPKSNDHWVLWSRINNKNRKGAKGVVEIVRITYSDAGRYAFWTKSGIEISSTTLVVKETQKHHDISDMSFEERLPVLVSEAVLTFIDSSQAKHVLFENGIITEEAFKIFGSRIKLQAAELGEVRFTLEDLKSDDKGKYEVRDKNNGLVSIISVSGNMNGGTGQVRSDHSKLGITIAVAISFAALVGCCCCMGKYCCGENDAPVASTDNRELPVYVHNPIAMPASRPWPMADTSPTNSTIYPPPICPEVVGNYSVPYPPYPPAPMAPSGEAYANPALSAPLNTRPQDEPRDWSRGLDTFLTVVEGVLELRTALK